MLYKRRCTYLAKVMTCLIECGLGLSLFGLLMGFGAFRNQRRVCPTNAGSLQPV